MTLFISSNTDEVVNQYEKQLRTFGDYLSERKYAGRIFLNRSK